MSTCACEHCQCDCEECSPPRVSTPEELAAEAARQEAYQQWLWTPARDISEQVKRAIYFAEQRMVQMLSEAIYGGCLPGYSANYASDVPWRITGLDGSLP